MRWLLPFVAASLALALLARPGPVGAEEAPVYVAIGDSLAFGVGASVPEEGGYVAVTYDALRKGDRYRYRGLSLINLGVPGATSSDLLLPGGQLERALAEIVEREEDTSSVHNVDIITINIGANDIQTLTTPDSPCLADPLSSECEDRFRELTETLEENLSEVVQSLREAAPEAEIIVLDLYSPVSGRGGTADIIADLAVADINAVTRQVISRPELGVKPASVYDLFRGRADQLVGADALHPNDEGHAVMAEVVMAAIEGRQPVLPDDMLTPVAVEGAMRAPQGRGGLLPLTDNDGRESSLPLVPVLAIPVALLGLAVIAGAYVAARGR